MASRYWVGATSSWTDTNNWSASSGGSGGASVPTSADDVIFNSNSGTTTAVTGTDVSIGSLNMSGSTATLSGSFSKIYIYGNCTFNASVARISAATLTFVGGGTCTLTTNNAPAQSISVVAGYPGNAATLNISGTLTITAGTGNGIAADTGTLNTNNNTISAAIFYCYNSGTANLGSSTITLTKTNTSGDIFYVSSGTVNYGTSTIKIASSAACTLNFSGVSQSFYNLDIATSSSVSIGSPSHSFNNISNSVSPATLKFTSTYTQTVTNFSMSGTSGNLVTLNTVSGTGTFTLSKSSGLVSRDYLSITNSTATGGAGWFAGTHSTDGGGNTGWIFASPSAGLLTFW